jgi:hypothetical protein
MYLVILYDIIVLPVQVHNSIGVVKSPITLNLIKFVENSIMHDSTRYNVKYIS